MKIKQIVAREILDSRGFPTVECCLVLDNLAQIKASVPSGASVGKREALELRDGDISRYNGKGVLRAIGNIEKIIAPALIGKIPNVFTCDKIMLDLDATRDKSKLGANAILAVSIAIIRAQALCQNMELYELLAEELGGVSPMLPAVMFNILNGGVHADNGICFQEFMIMPVRQGFFSDALQKTVLVYQELKHLLQKAGYSVGVGDEGGFAPCLKGTKQSAHREALDFLSCAVSDAGFSLGKDFVFCLDVAASQFYNSKENCYLLNGNKLSAGQLVDEYKNLVTDYPIYSIEDGLAEDDWKGWKYLTAQLADKIQLVGDDIFVSNVELIQKGIEEKIANAVLIKPNQIGTVSEALDAISLCKKNGYKVIVSHRSGETSDDFISDLVVGTSAGQFKAGAVTRGERVVKYNRLLEIEEQLLHQVRFRAEGN